MTVTTLPNGCFRATAKFSYTKVLQVDYDTLEEAESLVEADRIYRALSYEVSRGNVIDPQITAAVHAVQTVPCEGDDDKRKWLEIIAHQLRQNLSTVRIHD